MNDSTRTSCLSADFSSAVRNAARRVQKCIRRKFGRGDSEHDCAQRNGSKRRLASALPSKEELDRMGADLDEPYYHELPQSEMQPFHEYDYPDFLKEGLPVPKDAKGKKSNPKVGSSKYLKPRQLGIPGSKPLDERSQHLAIQNKKTALVDSGGYLSMKIRDQPERKQAKDNSYVKIVAASFEKDDKSKPSNASVGRSASAVYNKKEPPPRRIKPNASLNLKMSHQTGVNRKAPIKPQRPPKPTYVSFEGQKYDSKVNEQGETPKLSVFSQVSSSKNIVRPPIAPKSNVVKPFIKVNPNTAVETVQSPEKPWKAQTGDPMIIEDMVKSLPTAKKQRFCSMSVEDLVQNLQQCGLNEMAKICEEEGLDGTFLNDLTTEELKEEFHLNSLQSKKMEKIKNGWRPLRKETIAIKS